MKTRIKENQHEGIPTSDRQDNHCGSYCDCGRLTAHALEQLDGRIGAGFNTMEEFDIREATPEDAEKIIAYLAQVGGETDYLSFGKEGLPISTEEEEKFIQNINKEEHSVLYVVWKNGEIIGDASLSGFSRRMSHRAEFGISVVKSEWGQGIGSALLQKCIMYAKEHAIELINLEVRSDNIRAIHVYEKYGFRKIGTSPAYYKMDGTYYDFDLMVLDLRRQRQ